MKRVHVLVEGQTEETFVRDVLAPHLLDFEVALIPVVAATKRVLSGLKFKGGVTSYEKLKRDLERLLGDTDARAVTTMIDYYALPADFPGATDLPPGDCYQRVEHLQNALRADFDDHRFLPYLSLHEFEALLLTSPGEIEANFRGDAIAEPLEDAVRNMGSPEEVDDGPETHPAARIVGLVPEYRKPLHGPVIARRIGLQAIRQECPHFDRWVSALETIA
ncbi:MAG: DUF4276 family protein [bacterium]|nr:DUF4276 family protein [bacterium]